jgi:hypothetical protein
MSPESVVVRLTEASLPRFLLEISLRRTPWILSVHGIVPRTQRILDRVANWARRYGHAKSLGERYPDLAMVMLYPPTILIYDIFRIIEPWLERYYQFARMDDRTPEYAAPYKQIVCQHSWSYQVDVMLVARANADARLAHVRWVGVPGDLLDMASAYKGVSTGGTAERVWAACLNTIVAVAAVVRAVGHVTARTRMRAQEPRNVFLAADHMEDDRDIRLFRKLSQRGGIALVGRMRQPEEIRLGELQTAFCGRPDDGRFTPLTAFRAIERAVIDIVRIAYTAGAMPSRLFMKVVGLPLKRVQIRSLLEFLRPRYYWGRDPYNAEHIIRHQELHRTGAISLGMSDGIPVYCIVFPHLRYISFDRFYVYGTSVYERYYRAKWPRGMRLAAAASHSLTEAQLSARTARKPADIAVFTGIFAGNPLVVSIIRKLAQHFPERTVYLQVKGVILASDLGRDFVARCSEGLQNVVHSTESVYALMLKARYCFTDPSSVLYEAAQLGACSFIFDVLPAQLSGYHRECRHLCVSTPQEAVSRIVDIESGRTEYPLDKLGKIIDLSGRTLVDAVCADIADELSMRPSQHSDAGEDIRLSAVTDRT